MKLNLKLKSSLKTSIVESESQSSSGKKDPRFLNYFDMAEGQRMEVLFIPCASGNDFWSTTHVHGPRAKVGRQSLRGVKPLACTRLMEGTACPVCDQMFEHYAQGDKEAGNRLQVSERHMAQVLVISSDIEVPDSTDGNALKLFNVPMSIMKILKQAILEDQIEEDDLPVTPFVIKTTKNGEYNQYDTSFFKRKSLSDTEFDALLEGKVVTQIDLTSEEFATVIPSEAEQVEWLEETNQKIAAALSGGGAPQQQQRQATPSRAAQTAKTEEFDEDVPASVTQASASDEDGSDEPEPANRISDLRSRLKRG